MWETLDLSSYLGVFFCFKRHIFLTFLPKSKPLFFNSASSEVLSGSNLDGPHFILVKNFPPLSRRKGARYIKIKRISNCNTESERKEPLMV